MMMPTTRPIAVETTADDEDGAAAVEEPRPHVLAERIGAEQQPRRRSRVFGAPTNSVGAVRRDPRPTKAITTRINTRRGRSGSATGAARRAEEPRRPGGTAGPAGIDDVVPGGADRSRRHDSLVLSRGVTRIVPMSASRLMTRRPGDAASRGTGRPECRSRTASTQRTADTRVVEHVLDDDDASREVGDVDRDHLEAGPMAFGIACRHSTVRSGMPLRRAIST